MEKKFGYKIAVRDVEDEKKLIRGIYSPSIKEWRDIIEDYHRISRARIDNKMAMFKLQMNLLMDIVQTYEVIAEYLVLLKNPDERQKQIEGEIHKSDLEFWEDQVIANQILLTAFKDIGDGILWRYFNFNRPLLFVISQNDDPGPINYTQGLVNEIHTLGDLVNDTQVHRFIFHAITNYGRIGDITIFKEKGETEFIEAKSKPNARGKDWKERIERQKKRLENLSSFANKNIGILNDEKICIRNLEEAPHIKVKEIRPLLLEAKSNGISSRALYPYLAFVITNFSHHDKINTFHSQEEKVRESIMDKGDKMFFYQSLKFYEFSAHRAPISIYPLEPSDIADILIGKVVISYHFNITRFFKEIEKSNWKVVDSVFTRNPGNHDPKVDSFISLQQGRLTIDLPITYGTRIIFEGLSLKNVLQICNQVKSAGPDNLCRKIIYGFSEEYKFWS